MNQFIVYQCTRCCARFETQEDATEHYDNFHFPDENDRGSNTPEVIEEEFETDTVDNKNCNTWTHSLIMSLISLMKDYDKKFDDAPMKKIVWVKLTKEFNKINNVAYDYLKLENKWKSLKRTYKNIKTHNNSTGRNRKNWRYFDAIDAILFQKPEIEAPATCSSHEGLVSDSFSSVEEPESLPLRSINNVTDKSSNFAEKRKQKENVMERRHQEKMARLDKFNEIFEKMVEKM